MGSDLDWMHVTSESENIIKTFIGTENEILFDMISKWAQLDSKQRLWKCALSPLSTAFCVREEEIIC